MKQIPVFLTIALLLSACGENYQTFRDYLIDGGYGPEMVIVPTGSFQIGGKTKKAPHLVEVKQFALGRYEITFAQYDKFTRATGREKPKDNGWGRDNRPVINVSWDDANAYIEWLTQQTNRTYRLPTEIEWEYAARAFTSATRFWGNNPNKACDYANVHDNTSRNENGYSWSYHDCTDNYAKVAPVGQFAPNAFGLFDMLGNVWELVANNSANENMRVLRGGAWSVPPKNCNANARLEVAEDKKLSLAGFRVVAVGERQE